MIMIIYLLLLCRMVSVRVKFVCFGVCVCVCVCVLIGGIQRKPANDSISHSRVVQSYPKVPIQPVQA